MSKKRNPKSYKFAWLLLLLPVTLLLQLLCKSDPALTESVYSRHIYPVLSAVISPVFGILPFSAAEAILLVLAALFVRFVVRGVAALSREGPLVLLRGLLKLAVVFCAGYFLFTVMWGLNYYRQPLATNLALKVGTPTATELSAVMNRDIEAINKLCPEISYDKSGHSYYAGGFSAMRMQVNEGYGRLEAAVKPEDRLIDRVTAWPKGIFPSPLMSYTGTEGIFIPFTYEPSIDTDYPQFILPFTISHETAHFKGFAREDEANFLAYLACESSTDVYFQYSGHMNAVVYLSNALYDTDQKLWQQDISKLDSRADSDLNYYNDYIDKHQTQATTIANNINNSYLQSQGQPGVVSYDNFVNLLCDEYRTHGD